MSLQPPLDGLSDYQPSERTRMVLALARFRQEWQQIVKDGSLLKVDCPVGLLFGDIVERLELSARERHVVLGGKLINEIDAFMETRVERKMPN
jgi:hypothetical protein